MDEPAQQTKPDRQRSYRIVLTVSVIVAVGVITGLMIYQRINQPTPTPTATVNRILPPATPKSYTDFYGYITAVDERVLTVRMTVTTVSGTHEKKDYQVSWDDSTEFNFLDDPVDGELTAATSDQFQVNDLVQVFGADDLGRISDFTATSLVKIITPSS